MEKLSLKKKRGRIVRNMSFSRHQGFKNKVKSQADTLGLIDDYSDTWRLIPNRLLSSCARFRLVSDVNENLI